VTSSLGFTLASSVGMALAIAPPVAAKGLEPMANATFLPFVIGHFLAQTVLIHLRVKAFAFGPAEWLWRTLTCSNAPKIRRTLIVAGDAAG